MLMNGNFYFNTTTTQQDRQIGKGRTIEPRRSEAAATNEVPHQHQVLGLGEGMERVKSVCLMGLKFKKKTLDYVAHREYRVSIGMHAVHGSRLCCWCIGGTSPPNPTGL